jgi:hypothetical protein
MSEKKDGFIANLFDAYKQAFVLLIMIIVYNIIPAGIAFLGFYLAYPTLDYMAFLGDVMVIAANPMLIVSGTLHYGYYFILVGLVLALVNFGAAFLFTASRNDRINKPLKIFQALIATWKILFTFAIIIAIFVGLYFGLAFLPTPIPLLNTILYWVALAISALSLLAMIFRVIDYLLELE